MLTVAANAATRQGPDHKSSFQACHCSGSIGAVGWRCGGKEHWSPPWGVPRVMLTAVTLNEIEKIFAVLERLDISREAVIIPLRPALPGSVRRLPNGKFEIIVDAGTPIDDWLPVLEEQLRSVAGI